MFPMWAFGEAGAEAGAEGSTEVRELREKVLLVMFRVGQDLAEVIWDSFINQCISGFFESRAGTFTYPVEV